MASVNSGNKVVDLGRFMGPPLIGAIAATALWGMTCMQLVVYLIKYPRDSWALKGFIIVLCLLDTLHEVFCFNALWQTLIPQFGDLSNISIIHADFMWQVAVSSIVSLLARVFFTWRIWLFSNKNWIFPIVLTPPSVVDTVESIIFAVKGAGKSLEAAAGENQHAFIAFVILVVTDLIIVITMCTLLWRRRTGTPGTDQLLLRLMTASVTTGAWTAVFGLISAILLVGFPRDFLNPLTRFPLCPLYCNAVLGNLNSRRYIAGTSELTDDFRMRRPGSVTRSFQLHVFSPSTSTTRRVHIEDHQQGAKVAVPDKSDHGAKSHVGVAF